MSAEGATGKGSASEAERAQDPGTLAVKICGVTSPDDAREAVRAGADAIGLVFAPSPRRVSGERARAILAAIPEGIERVAVFLEPDAASLAIVLALPFDAVQAEASWDGAAAIGPGRFFLPVVFDGPDLAARVAAARPLAGERAGPRSLAGCVLVDRPRVAGAAPVDPVDMGRAALAARAAPIVLAGGLAPANVARRVRSVRPSAVDVSSGVEVRDRPGEKDLALVRAFIEAARGAFSGEADRCP